MTYHVGKGLAQPGRLADLLRQAGADLVGLQEVAPAQADVLRAELSDVYPYQVLLPTGFAGKGLLSRFPVVRHEQLTLYPDRPEELQAEAAWVGGDAGSDHLPVLARLVPGDDSLTHTSSR